VAVVPIKAFGEAKSRLAAVLDDEEREDLVAHLFEGVLEACDGATSVDASIVVAGDPIGVLLGDPSRRLTMLERQPGLAGALALADEQLERMGAAASLVVVADLPIVSAADLDALVAAAPEGPCIVVAPTADGGTGALYRRPATVIATAFGAGSAAAHLAAAEGAGVAAVSVTIDGLSVDLDTPSQLADLTEAGFLRPVPPA
jgi:2-phospho-L-lactate guanylyltransferase